VKPVSGIGKKAASDRRAVVLRIEGNVQGVGFRNWVHKLALQHGLDGYVRNRRDGSVEALFAGSLAAVDEAIARCRIGPRSAKVTGVTFSEAKALAPWPLAGSRFCRGCKVIGRGSSRARTIQEGLI
jgi:acylphosphatase